MADGIESEQLYVSTFERLTSEDPSRAASYFSKIHTKLSEGRRLHCCLFLKEAGHLNLADQTMDILLQHDGNSAAVWYESAIVKNMLGENNSALSRLNRALALDPQLGAAALLRVAVLIKLGERQRAGELLAAAPSHVISDDQRSLLGAFNRSFDYWTSLLQRLDTDPAPVNFLAAATAIESALDNGRAFSLVRFGDGEGAFLVPDDDDDVRAVGDVGRRHFAQRWYGRTDDTTMAAIRKVADQLREASPDYDMIGAPNNEWCHHEWNIGSFQTLACCLSARSFAAAQPATLTQTSAGLDMAHYGTLSRLIRKAESVCVVTCHTDLAPRLAAATGQNKFETILIPPAHSDLKITGLTPGSHLDDSARILDAIDEARGNRLFLVGGGFLGKLYTHRAAQGGGVAIDVGSVLDGVLDYATRPNFYHISLAERFWAGLNDPDWRPA